MNWEQAYHIEDGTFVGAADVSIYYRAYRAKDAANPRTLVVQHGIGEHGKRYENLLEALSGKGYNVYLIDARGHGKSGGSRGVVTHFNQFLADLDRLIGIAKQKEGVSKVTLMGHSMGALISLFYAGEPSHQGNLDRLVLSGLPIEVKTNLIMNIKKGAGSLLAGAFPSLTVPTGLDANLISRDKSVVAAYKKDPLVHGSVGAYLGDFLLNSKEKALERATHINFPVYMFHGKEDAIALSVGSEEAFAKIPSKDKTLKIYDGLYHETMNELPEDRAKVLGDLVNWLQTH
ncbi:alpha/beta hydrolase [Leptospira wolffii]|uniref:Monoacylglycerol lipase n=1 Tax=Leptospira wolffii TaxID=409998 RepID=A0A2M9ZFX1_9LEPT|nr:alpha/beta hydrolase [Leptospira wolffii]PJZ67330.1 lysophospholipase [Leptospira wolffii]TGK62324.1 alpha/beta hydrolase [Leptospira wolffii]TGK68159.1 alpha/beta hydrolase [Leptospira wolffii]TGK74292.1 alpha/beta hydrolase [Leptospira wolffii]TGL32133.1 alpha/beta hydrolase [Leptospira wolffii]